MTFLMAFAIYMILGLSFAAYLSRRLDEDDMPLYNWILMVATLGWPPLLILHLYKSLKRGSFKKDGT